MAVGASHDLQIQGSLIKSRFAPATLPNFLSSFKLNAFLEAATGLLLHFQSHCLKQEIQRIKLKSAIARYSKSETIAGDRSVVGQLSVMFFFILVPIIFKCLHATNCATSFDTNYQFLIHSNEVSSQISAVIYLLALNIECGNGFL